uniref:Methyltransferase FkbM domain-containing protein n=1 Tax=viral metagenome TaxID=1070528 RepID=A0A6C0DJX3_9ZZZZ
MDPLVLTVYESPFPKIRVGRVNDGGYIIAKCPNITYSLLLSGGIDTDITFEEEFIQLYNNLQCYAFDGSIDKLPKENDRITFIKKFIGNKNNDMTTDLHDIIDTNDNIFVKMDIEGGEIPWIDSLSDTQINKFQQIVIEFHNPFGNKENEIFHKINKFHYLIHFHPNNCCGVRNHNGIVIPNIFECTYLHKKYFTTPPKLNNDSIPGPLDMKNTFNDDIYINYPPFVNIRSYTRLCIFNSLPQHYEMFAHVLDYCKYKGLQIDIYTNKDLQHGWLDYYQETYNIITWYPVSFFNPDAYDYIFLLTDDDRGFDPYWNTSSKVIITEHDGKRELPVNAYRKHQTRKFNLRNPPSDPGTWMMPVWENTLFEKYEKLTVLSVGNATNGINLNTLFTNVSDIDFILVDRDMDTSNLQENVRKYNKLDASLLIEYASKSHYILFWPTTEFSMNHKEHSASGSFTLGYSVGTPILVPESFLKPLDLKGLVGICENSPIFLEKPKDTIDFMNQRDALIERRNKVFDISLCQK